MAMKKVYYTVAGELLGEKSSGHRTDYLSDALGSITVVAPESWTLALCKYNGPR